MILFKLAAEKDLQTIAKLYRNVTYNHFEDGPPFQKDDSKIIQQLEDNYRKYLSENRKGIILIYVDNYLLGFCSFEPDSQISNCLFVNNFFLNFSHLYTITEAKIKKIKSEIIMKLIQFTLGKHYKKMSIMSSNYNNIKNQCIELTANSYSFCGLNYSYYEKFVFHNLTLFM